jgi:hypothetical protein
MRYWLKVQRQYHKTVLSLFTILLPTLDPTDHRFITSARSACSVCIAYKRLNQQKTLSYTMISLHSCFVAGLTLMYCLRRNRSLFGYEALEATQACSQSLTIFGEKWSGAVKYRDIFDALSGSLFKTLVNPGGQSIGASPKLSMPGGDMNRRPSNVSARLGPLHEEQQRMHDEHGGQRETTHLQSSGDQPMSKLVSDAVKEAFMEVDEEAPGGWQGWRMGNEMLGDPEDTPEILQPDREGREDYGVNGTPGDGPWDYSDPLQRNFGQGQDIGYGALDEALVWGQTAQM